MTSSTTSPSIGVSPVHGAAPLCSPGPDKAKTGNIRGAVAASSTAVAGTSASITPASRSRAAVQIMTPPRGLDTPPATADRDVVRPETPLLQARFSDGLGEQDSAAVVKSVPPSVAAIAAVAAKSAPPQSAQQQPQLQPQSQRGTEPSSSPSPLSSACASSSSKRPASSGPAPRTRHKESVGERLARMKAQLDEVKKLKEAGEDLRSRNKELQDQLNKARRQQEEVEGAVDELRAQLGASEERARKAAEDAAKEAEEWRAQLEEVKEAAQKAAEAAAAQTLELQQQLAAVAEEKCTATKPAAPQTDNGKWQLAEAAEEKDKRPIATEDAVTKIDELQRSLALRAPCAKRLAPPVLSDGPEASPEIVPWRLTHRLARIQETEEGSMGHEEEEEGENMQILPGKPEKEQGDAAMMAADFAAENEQLSSENRKLRRQLVLAQQETRDLAEVAAHERAAFLRGLESAAQHLRGLEDATGDEVLEQRQRLAIAEEAARGFLNQLTEAQQRIEDLSVLTEALHGQLQDAKRRMHGALATVRAIAEENVDLRRRLGAMTAATAATAAASGGSPSPTTPPPPLAFSRLEPMLGSLEATLHGLAARAACRAILNMEGFQAARGGDRARGGSTAVEQVLQGVQAARRTTAQIGAQAERLQGNMESAVAAASDARQATDASCRAAAAAGRVASQAATDLMKESGRLDELRKQQDVARRAAVRGKVLNKSESVAAAAAEDMTAGLGLSEEGSGTAWSHEAELSSGGEFELEIGLEESHMYGSTLQRPLEPTRPCTQGSATATTPAAAAAVATSTLTSPRRARSGGVIKTCLSRCGNGGGVTTGTATEVAATAASPSFSVHLYGHGSARRATITAQFE